MSTHYQENDNLSHSSHSRSDPGRRKQRRRPQQRTYTASAVGAPPIHEGSMFTFNPREYGERVPNDEVDTRSVIQRAARTALLDDVTPTGSTIFSSGDASDDDDDHSNNVSGIERSLSNIRSLETPSLPALPDEQDRKRFVGCLAAVLSSIFDYESHEVLAEQRSIDQNDTENEVSGFFDFYESSDDEESAEGSSPSRNKSKHNNKKGDRSTSTAGLSQTASSDTSDNFYSSTCKSFESIGSSATGTTATSSATSNRLLPKNLIPPTSKIKSMASFRQQAMNVQKLNGQNSKIKDQKTKLSRQRYLSRRYELYSSLLLSSSELLLLDKSIARAFLPMLSRVLVPQIHKTQDDATNTYTKTTMKPQHEFNAQTFPSVQNSETEMNEGEEDPSNKIFHLPDMHLLDNVDELSPFLDSMTPGSGFRCVALLLLQYLLTSENGYDARIRHAVKKLSILVLRRDMDDDPVERELSSCEKANRHSDREALNGYAGGSGDEEIDEEYKDYERRRFLQATRKFEALEQNIARRLILLSSPARNRKPKPNNKDSAIRKTNPNDDTFITREQVIRGVKIGGAGILAGTLFAVTGGLAAPGIAAGIAAVTGAAAGTAAVSALTSAAVVTTIFGVGGGGLAAYKMQRRTRGVTEFEFCRETTGRPDRRDSDDKIEAELFSILCISGWLRDECDFQRPWGLQPSHPKITDRKEKLERFYSIYSPSHIPKVERILHNWRGEEDKLWEILRQKYGRDPDHLFPLNGIDQIDHAQFAGKHGHGALTLDQEEILDKLFVELGYNSVAPERGKERNQHDERPMSPFERMKNGWKNRHNSRQSESENKNDSLHGPSLDLKSIKNPSETLPYAYGSQGSSTDLSSQQKTEGDDSKVEYEPPKHLSTVWDWKTTYGGEMYTVKWESDLLTKICDCVTDLAVDVVTVASRQILKQTVLHTLLAAVILPTYLLNLMDAIDGDWTIAVERADEAGVVLAKTLLYSRAGRRPVTLVGYSFGARIIYSCLKELARYQEEWEHYQELLEQVGHSKVGGTLQDSTRLEKYKKKMKGMREPASIVEDVVFLGLPNHLSLSSWKACRQVVAGRLVNCYSTNDLILSLMFQAKRFSGGSLNQGMGSLLKPVCGTCPVEVPGVENINCSDLIQGHQDYCLVTGNILKRIGFGEPIRFVGEGRVSESITT